MLISLKTYGDEIRGDRNRKVAYNPLLHADPGLEGSASFERRRFLISFNHWRALRG